MHRLSPTSPRLCFGSFMLDPSSGQLRKNDILIKLPPQPFRLLQLLVERAGIVVTREEIRDFLWADSTFVEFEPAINFSINQIRAALSDDAQKPRYVETLPRRGYRFIAPVERSDGNHSSILSTGRLDDGSGIDTASFQLAPILLPRTPAVEESPHDAPGVPISVPREVPKLTGLATAVLVTLVFFAIVFAYRFIFPAAPRVLRIEQITRSGRVDGWQRVISDGSRLYYLERAGDHWNNMEIATAGGESQLFHLPLKDTNTRIFDISPNGAEFLAAPFRSLEGNLPLWISSVVGGAARRLGDLTTDDAAFSPNDAQIALAKTDGIYLADADGSSVHKIADLPGELGTIAWSPDGKLLRFTQRDSATGNTAIWEATARGGNLHRLFRPTPDLPNQCCGQWTADGSYYLFTVSHDKTSDLWALKEPPFGFGWIRRQPVRLTSGPISYANVLPGKVGQIAYALGGGEIFNVVVVDPKTATAKPILPEEHIFDAGFSPDGQWLFYITDEALWRSRPDGSERLQLAANSPQASLNTPRWRPDSKFLLYFEQRKSGSNQMYVVPSDGGPRRAILEDDHFHYFPDWSADGQTIVFTIEDERRPEQVSENGIYLYDLQNGQTIVVPDSDELSQARWSPDGRYLAAVSNDSSRMELYDFSKKIWTEIVRGKWVTLPVWSRDSKFVYYQDFHEPGQPISRFRLQDSTVETVFNLEGLLKTDSVRCNFLGLAPDGSALIRAKGRSDNLYKLQLDLP
jgi:Tol biopolymer transport system component/DNA-binding winged helix-turn-helix (wHTH) protein